MGTTTDAVTGTISKLWNDVCTIQPQKRTHLKQTTAVVGMIVNLRMVTTIVTSTIKALVRVLLDLSHNNGHLVFLTKRQTMMCPYSKRLIPQSWNTLNGISQRCSAKGELNFLSTLITEGFLQSRMRSSPTETLIAKGSCQNLARSSTTRIVSHYMTSFFVLHHERVRYRNGLLKPRR
jgi:hypothetical protein